MALHHVQMGLVTGSRWSGSDCSPPGIFSLGGAGETGEQVITLITLRNLQPGKLPLARRGGSCRTHLCNPCLLTNDQSTRMWNFCFSMAELPDGGSYLAYTYTHHDPLFSFLCFSPPLSFSFSLRPQACGIYPLTSFSARAGSLSVLGETVE